MGPPGHAISQGLLDLCRIDSDLADQPIPPGRESEFFMWLFSDVMAKHEQAKRLRIAGWLPHPILPIDTLVGSEKNPDRIRATVAEYFEAHRDDIYAALLARFSGYTIEAHACHVAKEAVAAHRINNFRLIVPAVFPEIERCARTTLGLGSKRNPVRDVVALIEKDVPISEMDPFLAIEAIELLANQMYKSINTPEEYDRVKDMPHRHGALHGLIGYETERDGLNALFLLDFVLTACQVLVGSKTPLTAKK